MSSLVFFFTELCGKNTDEWNHNERTHQLEKKTPKIINRSKFFWAPTSWQLQPYYSKPAVNRQPGFRRKDSQSLLPRPALPDIEKCKFPKKNEKILKNLENHKIHQIYQNFPGTAQLTLLEQMNSRLAPWFSFSLNLVGKYGWVKLWRTNWSTREKNHQKLQVGRNSKPAVNRQPGFRREDSESLPPRPDLLDIKNI